MLLVSVCIYVTVLFHIISFPFYVLNSHYMTWHVDINVTREWILCNALKK